jgi:CheY-like chemotaxis protein
MKITMAPTDILRDVLEPVASILYLRGNKVEVIAECTANVVVISDRLRLKQVVSNLAMNATKFVERGFIRLKCVVIETQSGTQSVQLHVEDSGPGIPQEKRSNLFAKFQESLDLLNQGTGIGLCLSKHLTNLMKGDLWLDESYDSGFEGNPGARFILDLHVPPLKVDYWGEEHLAPSDDRSQSQESNDLATLSINGTGGMDSRQNDETMTSLINVNAESSQQQEAEASKLHHYHQKELPESLNVLFVDDDMILRKLFCRSLRRVAPGWTVQEASNGETSLHMVEDDVNKYDVIFMDQYMSSIEKQLLGTETVRMLRAKGATCLISGLSANDMETPFLEAGADHFLFKPFPCETGPLKRALLDIVCGPSKRNREASIDPK